MGPLQDVGCMVQRQLVGWRESHGTSQTKSLIVFKMEISVVCLAIQLVVCQSPAQRPLSALKTIHAKVSSQLFLFAEFSSS